ncbi:hypothetical protein FD13_GL000304 [Levilactobacillus senmaizukei DSM 21775 = NBRC 103853]|uniref:Uncharacterized protein n=1 Tax=Levilactobacillus senmaizukei DSM 21775 = NBRC 103853 TaxID=1423803 RepID=A0A0R2DQJ8_9LACO|nr:hypothetical protein [Levilactobacillus senmaizukei]KRN02164.1 hypothetical protein FD13_GL000304 [Levilactobacillus senmaizukei DSM 21775 = NBRC 103853]
MAAKNVLDAKQVKRTISYKNKDGEDVTKEITLNQPNYETVLDVNDMQQRSGGFRDFGSVYETLMKEVLVNPRMDYKFINESVEKNKDDKGTIEFEDRDGGTVKLNVIFPSAREATNIIFNIQTADGSANLKELLGTLNDDVFRDDKGHKITWAYWDEHGGGYNALPEANKFLLDALVHTGFWTMMQEANSFLQERA